jgi:5-(hydroxymethyl)furfural/furfural oxidase
MTSSSLSVSLSRLKLMVRGYLIQFGVFFIQEHCFLLSKLDIVKEYDVAIVGAGAAGSILAARLTEDRARHVVLIEAGIDTPPGHVPADIRDEFPTAYSNPSYFWPGLTAIAQPGHGKSPFPQARVMGGGSSVMGMWALRGMPGDYDAWRDAGVVGWSWDDVLPFFRKLESDLDYSGPFHGNDGPIPVRRNALAVWPQFVRALAAAANKLGLPLRDDMNGDFEDGVFPVPVANNADGRVSGSDAYLTSAVRNRFNLTIMTEVEARRIVFSGHQVTGLEVFGKRRSETLRCRQVIAAAGAIGSPTLLLRSGIGPGSELQTLGISPIVDLRGVGENLQNHCILNFGTRIAPSARQSHNLRSYGLACARLSSGHANRKPGDLHLQFITKTSLHPHGDRIGLVGAALYAPLSRGKVSLIAPHASIPPKIEFRFLEHASDRERMMAVVRAAMGLLTDPAVRARRDDVFTVAPSSMVRRLSRPGIVNYSMSLILAMVLDAPASIRRQVIERAGKVLSESDLETSSGSDLLGDVAAIFHPAGTCSMGVKTNPLSVVDSVCRVWGTVGLRVVDASIMPSIPTGNTCLPTMMIGERAARLISDAGL